MCSPWVNRVPPGSLRRHWRFGNGGKGSAAGDANAGKQLYLSTGCFYCDGRSGQGGCLQPGAPSLKQQLRNPSGDRPAYAEGAAGPARRDGFHDPKRLNAVASGHGFSAGHTLESLQTVIGKTLPRGLCSGMAWGRAASLGLQSEPVRWIGRRLYGEAQYQWRYA
jgi:hypothetical protein